MFKVTVVFLAIIYVAFAALALGPVEPKPEKFKDQEGCYIKDLDAVIPFGKAKPAKKGCMEYRCLGDYVEYVSCGAVGVSPPCYKVEDRSKPYPDCCAKIKCPDH